MGERAQEATGRGRTMAVWVGIGLAIGAGAGVALPLRPRSAATAEYPCAADAGGFDFQLTAWRSAVRRRRVRCIALLGGDWLEQPIAVLFLMVHVMLDEPLRIVAEL